MGEQNRSESAAEQQPPNNGEKPVRQWTVWEVLGLLVSAILVAGPLLSLGYAFIFPAPAPAQGMSPAVEPTRLVSPVQWPLLGQSPNHDALLPTPTSIVTSSPSPGPSSTPTTPAPTVPTNTPSPETPIATPSPGIPTETPTPGAPTATQTPPTPSGNFTVGKVANVSVAYPGDTIVFSIGLSNNTAGTVQATVLDDSLPPQLNLGSVSHTCPSGSISYPGGYSFQADVQVPAGQACQIVVQATVVQSCDCYVYNSGSWSGWGSGGNFASQGVWLPYVTPAPTTPQTPSATPITPPPPTTASPLPSTSIPTTQPTPGPTSTTGPVTPAPTSTTGPPTPIPTYTPVPTIPLTPVQPTVGPTTPRPTRRPGPPEVPDTQVPVPTPVCAQARVAGDVCVAGVKVTISSCCPTWSASTTTNASGRFEFAKLTVGTFTVSAQGRSRTVRLEKCNSVATVNLCPVSPVPTAPVTPVTPTTSLTVLPTATEIPTTPGPPGTQPPTSGNLTLLLTVDQNPVQPGQSLAFDLTLHSAYAATVVRDVEISSVFSDALVLRGAAAPNGDVRLLGQEVRLTNDLLGAGQDLRLHVDAAVRWTATPWTTIVLQASARVRGGDMIYSNVLLLEIIGPGAPPPSWQTPAGVATPVGGPGEQLITPIPTQAPGGLGGQIPATGTGLPMLGVLSGGVVLLARQLRLRRAARRRQGSA